MGFIELAAADDLSEGSMKMVLVDGQEILLAREVIIIIVQKIAALIWEGIYPRAYWKEL